MPSCPESISIAEKPLPVFSAMFLSLESAGIAEKAEEELRVAAAGQQTRPLFPACAQNRRAHNL